jgi:hypothetical protein
MGVLVDENPELPIPKIAKVKSTTLCISQQDGPDLSLRESGFRDP